mmetsp:Transcript_50501/g.80425  ORF Transcript_50501/g.80425 Transcript_50501/m.80425 type:complete len:551 (-) Transcript_50501:286-1938(-)|eukprot:CAMPEP_0197030646 /NCGR_PEP_ID=MMETSP1384-20130603/9838_1 /TAXON_ID=29189 /ORGANISM="Ammonia sp." /LENGTH=550 /DNA_ID=CAMNT_0042460033 /DNA_START=39 /DNA_END=1691 /DNA_ORIENTATION=+
MNEENQAVELVADNSDDNDVDETDELINNAPNVNDDGKLSKTPEFLDALAGGTGNVDVTNPDHAIEEYSVDEAISSIGTGWFQFKLILITGLFWATDAMEMMIITILQPVLIDIWQLDEISKGTIAISVYMGMLFGTFTLGTISDRIGRKLIVIIACIAYSLFSLISAFSINYTMLLITRFVVGFFIGGNAVAFTLFAEFSPTKKRGRMLVVQQAFWCFGALFASTLGWICMDYLNWRYFLMLSSIPIWCVSLFAGWIPESPHYSMLRGQYEETKKTLKRVAISNGTAMPSGYLKSHIVLNKKRGRLRDVFTKKYRRTSFLLYLMLVASVFSYFGLSFIAERIFIDDAGNQYEENVVAVLGEVPALIIGIIVIDRIGRKTTLTACFSIYACVCFLLCFESIRSIASFGVSLVFIGRMFISLAFMTEFIYFSEFYPTAIRATAIGGASSLDEVSKIAADYLAQDISNISQGMAIFGCVGLVSLLCAYLLPVETLGRQLEEDVDYGSKMQLHSRGTMRVQMEDNDKSADGGKLLANEEELESDKEVAHHKEY